jgi:ribonuclease BN (tRNA processing enzyme)
VLRDIINEHGYRQDVVKEMFGELLAKMKLKKFMPSKVFHCPFSYGVVIEHNNGIKISYSGDCRPTPEFL